MKKLSLALCLLCTHVGYALPVGNLPEASLFCNQMPRCNPTCFYDCFNFGVGFYGDYVFNQHLETVRNKDIDTTRIFTNAGYFSLSFCERVELFSTLGVSRLSLNTSLGAFSAADPHPLFEVESGSAFSYSVGGRATLFQCKCLSFGFMGQYFATSPNIKRLYIAAGAVSYPDDNLKTRYHSWQVAPILSYRYNEFFIPYVALKYTNSHWKLANGERFVIESNTTTFLHNLQSNRHWGYAVGLTLYPLVCEKIAITVEGRFLDEKALYVNGQMRF